MKKRRFNYPYFANMLASRIVMFFSVLLCCMTLAVSTSCSDDETDSDTVDDPEKLADPLPTTDQLEVTHDNTLYYLSDWSKEDHAISDNMVNRYKEALPYASGTKMKVGDAFFFTREDIARIQSDAALLADVKDMFHNQSIVMMMEGGTYEDFNTLCTLLDCYNPYPKEYDSQSDDLSLWVFSGPLPSASGFYSRLNALTTAAAEGVEGAESGESVQVTNEYGQGVHCDMTSQSLQKALEPKPLQSGSSNLTDLISAYIVTGHAYYAVPRYGHGDEEIHDNFQVEAKIWTAYSEDQKRHFYLVNLGFIVHVENSFYGEWHSNSWKGYGCCLTNVDLEFAPFSPNGAIIHAHSPQTTEHQSSYTSSDSLQLGGIVNVNGPQIQGGVTISNSHTETINDIDVINRTDPAQGSPQLRWRFDLREPSSHFNMLCHGSSAIDAGAKAGISTCSLSTDFIFSVPEGADNTWVIDMNPTLKVFFFNDMLGIHDKKEDVYNAATGIWYSSLINLPTVY